MISESVKHEMAQLTYGLLVAVPLVLILGFYEIVSWVRLAEVSGMGLVGVLAHIQRVLKADKS